MKECIKCSSELNDDAKFCPKCGEKQVEKQLPSSFSSGTISTAYKFDILKLVGGIIVALLGLISVIVLIRTGNDLTTLRSVGGETVAEVYYQSIGSALIGIALFVAMLTVYYAIVLFSKVRVKQGE